MTEQAKKIVLLVEDDKDHADIVCFHISEYAPEIEVVWLHDGEAAIHYIEEGHDQWPWIVLLDIKLPKYDGHEVLSHMKAKETFNNIPVIIFTTSNALNDIEQALSLGANSYIKKPIKAGEFGSVITEIIDYWSLNQHGILFKDS